MLRYLSSYQCYRMPMSYQRYKGFTLVEMSIVLVIIGLILGGVMGGQALVRSARLNSVVTDINKFKTYINTFQLQYNALPGDIKNAYDYGWGVAEGCTNELMVIGGTGCNGNGDGRIILYTEGFRAWQHLTASGIMPGSYTGVATNGSYEATIGINVPASRVDGGGYSLRALGLYGQTQAIYVHFASKYISAPFNLFGSIVTSSEAQSIDKKMDDGLADHGSVMAIDGNDMTGATDKSCVNWITEFVIPSPYNLSTTSVSCRMYFKMD